MLKLIRKEPGQGRRWLCVSQAGRRADPPFPPAEPDAATRILTQLEEEYRVGTDPLDKLKGETDCVAKRTGQWP